jgi:hypothetical protein
MWFFKQPSSPARTALIYITSGAFIVIWTAVWFVYLYNNHPDNNIVFYWCTGFLMTGLTLAFIGLVMGRMNRSARQAGLPPEGVPFTVVNAQPNAAAIPAPVAVPTNSIDPLAAPIGQGLVLPPQAAAGRVLEAKQGSFSQVN